jgi:hypothetical protein
MPCSQSEPSVTTLKQARKKGTIKMSRKRINWRKTNLRLLIVSQREDNDFSDRRKKRLQRWKKRIEAQAKANIAKGLSPDGRKK